MSCKDLLIWAFFSQELQVPTGSPFPVRFTRTMFEVFTHGFSFLNLLSLAAFFTTVALFFCGIPICRQIWKRRDTKEISGAPFLMGVLGGCCWMTYGYLKNDQTVLVVTGCQVILYLTYSMFYWFMSKDKFWITVKVGVVVALCTALILSVKFFGMKVFHPLGIVCMTLNIADFAAPLIIQAALSSGNPQVVADSIAKSMNFKWNKHWKDTSANWAVTVLQADFNNPAAHLNVSMFADPTVWCSVYIGIDPRLRFPYLYEIQLVKVIQTQWILQLLFD
ncbi:hypothetical protein GCK32_014472 [Trichostrongylus colubriformis]|uniref:Sugar transporter SWEET n=1 Tax=Trichostrongylus colubriformis TaxID=6319 RepID=A0AAN8GA89_TRICO